MEIPDAITVTYRSASFDDLYSPQAECPFCKKSLFCTGFFGGDYVSENYMMFVCWRCNFMAVSYFDEPEDFYESEIKKSPKPYRKSMRLLTIKRVMNDVLEHYTSPKPMEITDEIYENMETMIDYMECIRKHSEYRGYYEDRFEDYKSLMEYQGPVYVHDLDEFGAGPYTPKFVSDTLKLEDINAGLGTAEYIFPHDYYERDPKDCKDVYVRGPRSEYDPGYWNTAITVNGKSLGVPGSPLLKTFEFPDQGSMFLEVHGTNIGTDDGTDVVKYVPCP